MESKNTKHLKVLDGSKEYSVDYRTKTRLTISDVKDILQGKIELRYKLFTFFGRFKLFKKQYQLLHAPVILTVQCKSGCANSFNYRYRYVPFGFLLNLNLTKYNIPSDNSVFGVSNLFDTPLKYLFKIPDKNISVKDLLTRNKSTRITIYQESPKDSQLLPLRLCKDECIIYWDHILVAKKNKSGDKIYNLEKVLCIGIARNTDIFKTLAINWSYDFIDFNSIKPTCILIDDTPLYQLNIDECLSVFKSDLDI